MNYVNLEFLETVNSRDYFQYLVEIIYNENINFSKIEIHQDEINYLFDIHLYIGVTPRDEYKKFLNDIKPFLDIAKSFTSYERTYNILKITADKIPLESLSTTEILNVYKSLNVISKFNL